jgi:hypothetical protein
MSTDQIMERYQIENKQKWREEIATMPWIQFPADWKIQIIPPFGDAVVRFRVTLPSGAVRSVYLDARHSLGLWRDDKGEFIPYWEVYPHRNDVGRCDKDNIDELLEMIACEVWDEKVTV